jgi:hypothetical protein
MNLNKALFWDTDYEKLDYERHARKIIERVITRGTLQDWWEIKKYYGKERIKSEIVTVRSLDKLSLNFCSNYFNVPKTEFRCYNTNPSTQQLWNF